MTNIVLSGGNVWDGRGESAVAADVIVADGVIAAEVPHGLEPEIVDVSGCTVLPGLIEAHAHLCFDATREWRRTYDGDSPVRMALRMAANAGRMLKAGITTVRDLGAPTELAVQLREAVRTGLVTGPDLLVAGAPITTTGGHCYFMGGEADGELELRRAVRRQVKAGVDWIKVMATGGNMTPGTNTLAAQYTVDELRAVVQESHRLNRRVAAHCHGTDGIRNAVAAGVDTLEHCSFQGPGGYDFDPQLAAAIAAAGIVVSPTVSIGWRNWPDDGRRRERGAILRAMLDAGCPFVMSTDCGIPGVPHEALGAGLQVICQFAGLAPVEGLRLATSRSAELLGLEDRGTLEAGKRADLLVVAGDPLGDIAALERIRFVISGGRVVPLRA